MTVEPRVVTMVEWMVGPTAGNWAAKRADYWVGLKADYLVD
jgi:hypothetical protein